VGRLLFAGMGAFVRRLPLEALFQKGNSGWLWFCRSARDLPRGSAGGWFSPPSAASCLGPVRLEMAAWMILKADPDLVAPRAGSGWPHVTGAPRRAGW